MHKNRLVLFTLFLTIFIDVLGFGLVVPVLTPLFLDPVRGLLGQGVSGFERNLLLGVLLASFPLAQFFGAPILGTLADRYGRKKMLLLSLQGAFLGYAVFTLGIHFEQVWLLFVGRLVAGFMGGNLSISMSMIADISQKADDKTRRFGLMGVAVAMGVVLGPVIGGVLSYNPNIDWFSYETPFVLASILALANVWLVKKVLTETYNGENVGKIDFWHGPKNVWQAFVQGSLRGVFLMTFFQTLGFNFFAQFFAAYLLSQFGATELQTGYMFAYVGFWVALSQGFAVRFLAGRVAIEKLIGVSLFCLAATFLLLLLPERMAWFYVVLPLVAFFHGVVLPNTTALISSKTSSAKQGEVLGVYQSVQALGQVLPPVVAGLIASLNYDLPILAAAVMTLVAGVVFRRYVGRSYS